MSRAVQVAERSEPDLIDRIADSLPAEIRADFYREMRHCRSLPENDEMLRIIRIMQFLTLLIHTAPSRLAAERESLDHALSTCADALGRTVARLNGLPQEVAGGMRRKPSRRQSTRTCASSSCNQRSHRPPMPWRSQQHR
jgi:hypothetical protein